MKISIPIRVRTSLGLFVLAGLLFVFCYFLKNESDTNSSHLNPSVLSTGTDDSTKTARTENQRNTQTIAVLAKPKQTAEVEGRVRGENAPILFEKDLETSISKQGVPSIRLDFVTPSGYTQSLDIGNLDQTTFSQTWQKTLQLCLKNTKVTDFDSKFEIQRNYLNSNALAIQHLDNLIINSPNGSRKITDNEAANIVKTLNTLAIRRFEELTSMAASIQDVKFVTPISN